MVKKSQIKTTSSHLKKNQNKNQVNPTWRSNFACTLHQNFPPTRYKKKHFFWTSGSDYHAPNLERPMPRAPRRVCNFLTNFFRLLWLCAALPESNSCKFKAKLDYTEMSSWLHPANPAAQLLRPLEQKKTKQSMPLDCIIIISHPGRLRRGAVEGSFCFVLFTPGNGAVMLQ